jgi:hypothetical protein
MEKIDMDELYHPRFRIVGSITAPVLAFAILLISGCGGGATGEEPETSSTPTTSNTVTLAWDPVTATNHSGYRIYYGTAPRAYLQPHGQGISVGNVTTYTLMGLSSKIRYYFAVTAFDVLGNESGYSNEASKDIP